MIDTETFQHSNKRRAISNGLHGKATKHIEESVTRNLEKLCSIITKNILYDWSSSFNVAEMFNYLSFDIMGDVCFGRTFNMQEQKEHRYIVDIVSDGAQCLNTVNHTLFYTNPTCLRLNQLGHMQKLLYTGLHRVLFRKLLNGLKSYQRYSKEQCAQAIADPPKNIDQRGVFQFLLDAESPKTGNPLFTPLELQSESSLLIIAGSDTTSTCLAATVFYLLHHPSCMKEAIEEVSSVFSQWKEGLLEPSELQKCRYLRACIEESLRMSPPVGGLMPRETLVGGMTVDGEHFPENTELGTPHYAIHHNERYYPDPFSYNPRRWLVDSTPQSSESATTPAQLAAAEEAFCPFSIGPRNCVGKQFAYHELMSVMARLLLQFDMRLQPGSTLGEGSVSMGAGRQRKDEYQLYDAFASKNEGPMVQFRRRRR